MNKYKKILAFWVVFFKCCTAFAADLTTLPPQSITYPTDQKLYDQYPWALTYYYGQTMDNNLWNFVVLKNLKHWPEHIQSVELAKTIDENSAFRRFFKPIVGVVQLAGNMTVRQGTHESTIYEFAPYFMFRWANFPWNHYVTTSLAIGEGVSYASSVPAIEREGNEDTRRLLNYLMFEATFAHPRYPQLQFIARIHHRSGAFGLYGADNSGSNDIGVGIRYLFD